MGTEAAQRRGNIVLAAKQRQKVMREFSRLVNSIGEWQGVVDGLDNQDYADYVQLSTELDEAGQIPQTHHTIPTDAEQETEFWERDHARD